MHKNLSLKSYIPSSYIKFLEASGCFVLPIEFFKSNKTIRDKIYQINGLMIVDYDGQGILADLYRKKVKAALK